MPASESHAALQPSAWVVAQSVHLPRAGRVLDLACGRGRHARWLAAAGHVVLAVDRDGEALAGLGGLPDIATRQLDLEGDHWPLAGERFAGIVVTNYLWRPRLDALAELLAEGGVLIYETFMQGNAAYGKPSRPEFLLAPGELRAWACRHGLRELAFTEGYVAEPKPAMRQAICVRRD